MLWSCIPTRITTPRNEANRRLYNKIAKDMWQTDSFTLPPYQYSLALYGLPTAAKNSFAVSATVSGWTLVSDTNVLNAVSGSININTAIANGPDLTKVSS